MREEDKPFIYYRQGWSIKIVPRNAFGWKALGLWMLAILSPTIILIPFAISYDNTPHERAILWATIPVLLLTAAFVFAMIRWMKARSEIINIDDLLAFKREQDRKRKSARD